MAFSRCGAYAEEDAAARQTETTFRERTRRKWGRESQWRRERRGRNKICSGRGFCRTGSRVNRDEGSLSQVTESWRTAGKKGANAWWRGGQGQLACSRVCWLAVS